MIIRMYLYVFVFEFVLVFECIYIEWFGLTDSYNGSVGDDHQNVFGKR